MLNTPPLMTAIALCWAVLPAAALGLAQIDPGWVRDWVAAQEHRPASLAPVAEIAPANEPGEALVVEGRVVAPDGSTPAAGVIVFAYQTDRTGLYAPEGTPSGTWRLKAWALTDAEGRFRFRTIRPGPYPSGSEPEHIHFTLEDGTYGRQLAPTLHFADDPLVTDEDKRAAAAAGRFGNVAVLRRDAQGRALVAFEIRLKTRPDF